MNRTGAFVLTALIAMTACSCGPSADVARLQAEVEAAREEAAAAKAVAESVRAEVAKDKADAEAARTAATVAAERARGEAEAARGQAARQMAEVVRRWNAAAAALPAELPPPFGRVSFRWDGTHFPHPTFKGGSAEAYGAFAGVLIAFLETGDNFDYLAANGLFGVNLRGGVPGPSGPDAGWTFGQLISAFSHPASLGTHDPATRRSLKAFADRIPAGGKQQPR